MSVMSLSGPQHHGSTVANHAAVHRKPPPATAHAKASPTTTADCIVPSPSRMTSRTATATLKGLGPPHTHGRSSPYLVRPTHPTKTSPAVLVPRAPATSPSKRSVLNRDGSGRSQAQCSPSSRSPLTRGKLDPGVPFSGRGQPQPQSPALAVAASGASLRASSSTPPRAEQSKPDMLHHRIENPKSDCVTVGGALPIVCDKNGRSSAGIVDHPPRAPYVKTLDPIRDLRSPSQSRTSPVAEAIAPRGQKATVQTPISNRSLTLLERLLRPTQAKAKARNQKESIER